MKKYARIWENITILIVGILLIIYHSGANTLPLMVRAAGVMFIIPGIIAIFSLQKGRLDDGAADDGARRKRPSPFASAIGWIVCAAAIIFGGVLILFPDGFCRGLVAIISVALIIGGLYQFYMLGRGYRPIEFPAWFYVLPLLIILDGAYVIFSKSPDTERVELLLLAIGIVVYALTSFLEIGAVGAFRRGMRRQGEAAAPRIESKEEQSKDN